MRAKSQIQTLNEKEKILKKAAEILRVNDADLPRVVERFLKEIEEMSKKQSRK